MVVQCLFNLFQPQVQVILFSFVYLPAMSTPEEIFDELQNRFSYEKPITELILSKGLTTLAEFSHYCSDLGCGCNLHHAYSHKAL